MLMSGCSTINSQGASFVRITDPEAVRSLRSRPITRYLAANGAARLGILGVSGVLGLATTKVVLHHSDPATFAFVALVSSLLAFVPMGDLGTGAAVTNAIASSADPLNDQQVAGTLLTALRTLCAAGAGLAVCAILLSFTGLLSELLGSESSQPPGFTPALLTAVLSISAALPLGIGQRVLLGSGKNHVATICLGVAAPLTLGFVILVVVCGLPSGWFAACACLAWLLAQFLTCVCAQRTTGISLIGAGSKLVRVQFRGQSIRATAGPMAIIVVALPIATSSDRLVLSHVSDVPQLAAYALVAQLYGPLWSVAGSTSMALWPVFAARRASGADRSGLLRGMLTVFGAAALLGSVLLLTLGGWISDVLSDGEVRVAFVLFIAFSCLLVVQSLQAPLGMLLSNERGLRFQAVTVLAMLAINLPMSIVLARTMGAAGPVWSSVVSVALAQLVPCALLARRDVARTINGACASPAREG